MAPALVGGLIVAVLLALFHQRSSRFGEPLPRRDDAPLVDPINIAHIRITGIGGAGLVLLAFVVATYIPGIGVSLAIGAALGIVFSLILIVRRRRTGPLPSSGQRPGANTTLSIDVGESASNDETRDTVNLSRTSLVAAGVETATATS
jgi:hypothetical protein